jgi:hypothetical protein
MCCIGAAGLEVNKGKGIDRQLILIQANRRHQVLAGHPASFVAAVSPFSVDGRGVCPCFSK